MEIVERTERVKRVEKNERYSEIKPEQMGKAKELAQKISKILDEKKAGQVKIIETNKQTIIADYFVIATGTSSTHIRSLAGEVEEKLKDDTGMKPARVTGQESRDWVIMDYNSVLVHIFNSEARDYYKLEKLWGDGESINLANLEELEELEGIGGISE